MTDRYEHIRKALADMDAAAEARNGVAWRDAHARFIVHVPPDTIRELLAERDGLAAENEMLREALECMIIGACAVAVPHNGERAVLQDAVNIARAALAAYRKRGKQ